MNLNNRSFTISCWIKQMKSTPDELAVIYGDWHGHYLWQFILSTKNQSIVFHRHSTGNEEWWSLKSTNVSLSDWKHVVVTWYHVTRTVLIYANGKEIGAGNYSRNQTFHGPTAKPCKIGNDGYNNSHQFYGSVMDLYVFDWALTLREIHMLRGMRFMTSKIDKMKV